MAQQPFVTAEVDYRTARAHAAFPRSDGRFRVPRRRGLHLPLPRPRPLVAG